MIYALEFLNGDRCVFDEASNAWWNLMVLIRFGITLFRIAKIATIWKISKDWLYFCFSVCCKHFGTPGKLAKSFLLMVSGITQTENLKGLNGSYTFKGRYEHVIFHPSDEPLYITCSLTEHELKNSHFWVIKCTISYIWCLSQPTFLLNALTQQSTIFLSSDNHKDVCHWAKVTVHCIIPQCTVLF